MFGSEKVRSYSKSILCESEKTTGNKEVMQRSRRISSFIATLHHFELVVGLDWIRMKVRISIPEQKNVWMWIAFHFLLNFIFFFFSFSSLHSFRFLSKSNLRTSFSILATFSFYLLIQRTRQVLYFWMFDSISNKNLLNPK